MKILVRKEDNVVLYAQNNLEISDDKIIGDGWIDEHFNNDNSFIVDAEPPKFFSGSIYTYIDGKWNIINKKLYEELKNPIIIEPHKPPIIKPVTPEVVSMRQARLALLQNNLLDDIDTAVASMPKDVQITWEYATEVNRDNPLVASIKELMHWTDEQTDELFVLAGSL